MKAFIAVVKSTAGVLEKFQDYDTQTDADAHVSQFGGWVAPNPGGSSKHYWVIDENAKTLGYDQDTQDSDAAMSEWLTAIARTDADLPRSVEDLYDTGITPSDRTKKLMDAKKALRAERPGS
jgi:hypothetical protein